MLSQPSGSPPPSKTAERDNPSFSPSSRIKMLRHSLDRPVGVLPALLFTAILLVLPTWLFWDQLINFRLRNDDFDYLIQCRSGARPFSNLWKPHNTHIVPLFRLLTAVSARLSGGPGGLQFALLLANDLGLVLLMLAVGLLVARESRRIAVGLASMVLVGLTTVNDSAATWYSAGQTTWSAIFVVLSLLWLQDWRIRSRPIAFLGAILTCVASPLVWTGGLVAGASGSVYLWASGHRKAALAPLSVSLATFALILALAGDSIASEAHKGSSAGSFSPVVGLLYTLQAIPESILLAGLGLDTEITAGQGVILMALVLATWVYTRPSARPSPLESTGAIIAIGAYGMAFTLRSGYSFANLRDEGWYDTMPLVGVVLFLMGWWSCSKARPGPGRSALPTRRESLVLVSLTIATLLLNLPRAERQLLKQAPPLLPSERQQFPIASLQRLRALYVDQDVSSRQQRALIRLGQAAEASLRLGITRGEIRALFGRIEVPGWPEAITDHDALDLLVFPDSGPGQPPSRIRATLAPLLTPEPIERPPWITPDEPWPPPLRGWDSAS